MEPPGGGKTYALLLEGLRNRNVKGWGGVIFRHNYNQITAEGGLWDASHKIYDLVPDAVPARPRNCTGHSAGEGD